MIWSGQQVANYINVDEDQIQPNGVDLCVSDILTVTNATQGRIGSDDVYIPRRSTVEPEGNEWELQKGGYYIAIYDNVIHVPRHAIGLVLPRSSLMRMGALLHTALWDSGYSGRGEGLLTVHNAFGVRIERGAAIGQMIFMDAESTGSYDGRYQNEHIGDKDE